MPRYIWQSPKWASFSWDSALLAEVLAGVEAKRAYLYGQLDAMGFGVESSEMPLVDEALTSAAIEGEQLSRRAVRSSVARRLGLDTAGLPEPPRDVDGLVAMLLDATTRAAEPVTVERLCQWQAALFPTGYSGLTRIHVGRWREAPIEVVSGALGRPPQIHFEAPPAAKLDAEVDLLLAWFEGEARALPGVLGAGVAHLWFETLHPFDDGNGRVGRALAELALARADRRPNRAFSLSAQLLEERDSYYGQLEHAQRAGLDVTSWLLWFCGVVERALEGAKGQLAIAQRRARFWRRADQLVELSRRQRRVLERLLRAGPGGFAGGLSNRNYCRIAKVAPATAARDLAELTRSGLLHRRGAGRSTRYELAWKLAEESRDG